MDQELFEQAFTVEHSGRNPQAVTCKTTFHNHQSDKIIRPPVVEENSRVCGGRVLLWEYGFTQYQLMYYIRAKGCGIGPSNPSRQLKWKGIRKRIILSDIAL